MGFVFNAYLKGRKDLRNVTEVLDGHPQVIHWFLETRGRERTIKIEVEDRASKYGIVECIRILGFDCEELDR